jgi:hypothetical protein
VTTAKHPRHWKRNTIHESDLGEFVDVPDTDGMYRIARDGTVISQKFIRLRPWPGWWIILKTVKSRPSQPFNRVHIVYSDGVSVCEQLSRLLLTVFLSPPPTNDSVAAHLNGVSDDDRLENLTWAVPTDVKTASIVRGSHAHGDNHPSTRFCEQQVKAIRQIISMGVPVNMLARAMNEPQPRIRELTQIKRDVAKHHGTACPLTGRVLNLKAATSESTEE